MRDLVLRAVVVFGTTALILTEALGALHLLTRPALLLTWAIFVTAAIIHLVRARSTFHKVNLSPVSFALTLAIVTVAALTGITAALSPPNTFDALAYHMPRIVYWAQSQSVAFFATSYLNQISFPPFAEYLMLHTYVLAGSDAYVNLVVWAGFCGSIIGVSSIASALGASHRGQVLAAFFCATLPGAILQASGPKNDCVLALWLVCGAYFGIRGNAVFSALAFALAIATKATAYLFAPPLLFAIVFIRWRNAGLFHGLGIIGATLAAVLLLNAPLYTRNVQLGASPLGFESPFANGTFLPRNDTLGLGALISNALRHGADQLGGRSQRWNQAVYDNVLRLHSLLKIDPQDPHTTWQSSRYRPPENTRHEANASNKWHLLILCAAFLVSAIVGWRKRDPVWLVYAAGLLAGFLMFCWYLRWQPYGARLLVPLFILGAPVAGLLLERIKPQIIALGICALLLDGARLPLLENWTRPLKGPQSIFHTPRESRYFADIQSMNNEDSYTKAVDLVINSGCRNVGIDITNNQLEYPFQALVLRRDPSVRFQHVGVANPSIRYRRPDAKQPCAVLCLDCMGDNSRTMPYRAIGSENVIGRFLLFVPKSTERKTETAPGSEVQQVGKVRRGRSAPLVPQLIVTELPARER